MSQALRRPTLDNVDLTASPDHHQGPPQSWVRVCCKNMQCRETLYLTDEAHGPAITVWSHWAMQPTPSHELDGEMPHALTRTPHHGGEMVCLHVPLYVARWDVVNCPNCQDRIRLPSALLTRVFPHMQATFNTVVLDWVTDFLSTAITTPGVEYASTLYRQSNPAADSPHSA